jgi:hydrogenase nickel incorporation protein HypA/HybF
MHEMSIAQSLLGIVRQEMAAHGLTRVLAVHVRHGSMAAVVPQALAFAWEVLTRGTDLEEAALVLEEVPLSVRCSGCGLTFAPEKEAHRLVLIPCPRCGEDLGHEILAGKELLVDHIEAEVPDSGSPEDGSTDTEGEAL